MRPGGPPSALQRTWTVDIHIRSGAPAVVCRACGPVAHGGQARAEALRHLARHARHDVLPGHLRTCQCGCRGCPWHPRRRPCSGPVRLTLTCEANSRTWRLTDTCSQCRAAIPGAAAVPEPARTGPSAPVAKGRQFFPDSKLDCASPQPQNHPLSGTGQDGGETQGSGSAEAEANQVWDVTCARCGLPPDACWWAHSPTDPG